jgi:hypothetical protein
LGSHLASGGGGGCSVDGSTLGGSADAAGAVRASAPPINIKQNRKRCVRIRYSLLEVE